MRVRVAIEGEDAVLNALRNMDKAAKKRLRPKLVTWGERVLADAKSRVPVGEDDEFPGALRDSGRVIRPTISATASRLLVSVMFGGPALARVVRRANYAVIQHEDLSLQHNDGEAKFLERPFIAMAPQVPELVKEALAGIEND